MTLTLGSGPFATKGGGEFNFEPDAPRGHVLYLEDAAWRVRAEVARETIVDSRRVKRLHETGYLPVYYFPMDDVRTDFLQESDRVSHCPYKGDARYWSIRVSDRTVEDAMWNYPEPLDSSPLPADHVAFYFGAMDRWLEEDEEIFAHPRDPYHRVDVRESSRRVRVLVDGEEVAGTARPKILAETGLPVRYYIPPQDVRSELLVTSETRTQCPYKGQATYYSVRGGDGIAEDTAWSYHEPLPEGTKIAGHYCFLGKRVETIVDDEI